MSRKRDLNKIGFLDIVFRDEFNNPIFQAKRKRAGDGVKEFEEFCRDKLGIYPFDTKEFERKLEEKHNIKGLKIKL